MCSVRRIWWFSEEFSAVADFMQDRGKDADQRVSLPIEVPELALPVILGGVSQQTQPEPGFASFLLRNPEPVGKVGRGDRVVRLDVVRRHRA